MKADDKLEGNRTQFSVCLWLLTHNWDPFAVEMAQTLQNHFGRLGCDSIPNASAAQIQPI